ncbi:MAG: type III PLP-dependent enzyme [Rhodothalassiaceae bacterium]
MTAIFPRAFTAPFDRGGSGTRRFETVEAAVATIADDQPVHVLYPEAIARAADAFLTAFPGTVMYAVKCNPAPEALALLAESGIRDFDVASIAEIDAVRAAAPDAHMYFMHPVKSRRAIRYAYGAGIRDFALDSLDELRKIEEETGADDLTLIIRLALPKGGAALDLSGKFGAEGEEAVALLRAARTCATRLGISFHVGSQCLDPEAFARAIALARKLVDRAGVALDILDVGGGFPVAYPDMTPPPLADFLAAIRRAVADEGFTSAELWCEPGRALIAEGGSVLVKVELRKGDKLYLNDGTFGALFDAGTLGWRYPVRRVSMAMREAHPLRNFVFFGPTCDSMDRMEGPFLLPGDMAEGDWIEIGNLGAYGYAMRTHFNGFHSDETILIAPRERSGAAIMPLSPKFRVDMVRPTAM